MSPARRLHVLHVATATTGASAEEVLGQVRDQVERGWRVILACPSLGTLGYDAREAGAEVRWWRTGPVEASASDRVAEAVRLGRLARGTRPDVVHLHGERAGLAGRLVVRERRVTVLQPHGWDAPHRRLEQLADRWTTELVLTSDAERSGVVELGLRAPVTSLEPGVDLGRHRPLPDPATARARLGLPEAPTALVVGRLAEAGGQRDLLRGWPRVRERVPQARLVLVGDGPDRPALERQVAGLDGVVLAGDRADRPRWLAAADVVVVPARGPDPCPALLQAMATARSVVATDVAGSVEVVPPSAGEVVATDDALALVAAVTRRLADPLRAAEEGRHGRAHAELHHDLHATHRELARLYLRLVAARRDRDAGRSPG